MAVHGSHEQGTPLSTVGSQGLLMAQKWRGLGFVPGCSVTKTNTSVFSNLLGSPGSGPRADLAPLHHPSLAPVTRGFRRPVTCPRTLPLSQPPQHSAGGCNSFLALSWDTCACQFCNRQNTRWLLRRPCCRGRTGAEAGERPDTQAPFIVESGSPPWKPHSRCPGLQGICGCPTCVPVSSGQELCPTVSTLQAPQAVQDLIKHL